ncbi:MAG TPA: TetR/AcrR family transcriptional regulator, partial [Pseudoneobacillus sp.]|nr:TetR/AcrR family transcriptional regulator [Pseudoneobacillus sp.]
MAVLSNDYKEEQKNKVLASALECFATKGYEAATIDDIVNHSGISKGSIYKLFKSKEEIYIQLMYRNTDEMYAEIRVILAKNTSALDKLISVFTEYLDRELNPFILNSFLVQFETQLFASRKEDMMKIVEEIRLTRINIISDVLREGIQNGEFKKEIDVDVFSELFWSFVDGAVTHKYLFPGY